MAWSFKFPLFCIFSILIIIWLMNFIYFLMSWCSLCLSYLDRHLKRFGKFSSITLLKWFCVPLTWISSPLSKFNNQKSCLLQYIRSQSTWIIHFHFVLWVFFIFYVIFSLQSYPISLSSPQHLIFSHLIQSNVKAFLCSLCLTPLIYLFGSSPQ